MVLELRERGSGFDVTIVSVVIGALGGGIKEVLRDVGRVFSECLDRERLIEITVAEMHNTVLMDSKSIVRKVLPGLVQHEY